MVLTLNLGLLQHIFFNNKLSFNTLNFQFLAPARFENEILFLIFVVADLGMS